MGCHRVVWMAAVADRPQQWKNQLRQGHQKCHWPAIRHYRGFLQRCQSTLPSAAGAVPEVVAAGAVSQAVVVAGAGAVQVAVMA